MRAAAPHPYFQLPSGDMLPGFGLGSWQSPPGEVEEAVRVALEAGYVSASLRRPSHHPGTDCHHLSSLSLTQLLYVRLILLHLFSSHLKTTPTDGNEAEVGEGIRRSNVPRSQIWITTKLWNSTPTAIPESFELTCASAGAHRPEDVAPAFEKSRAALRVDVVDLYLMHYPAAQSLDQKVIDVPFTETWAAMEGALTGGQGKDTV
jgi:diketogulonate reductase-like aldo/keto reductase